MTANLPETIGFVGVGNMGLPMVRNLAQKLPEATVIRIFDVSKQAMEQAGQGFLTGKIKECKSPKEVAEWSEATITMLPEGSHVREVYLNPENGLLCAPLDNKLLIDCSTIDSKTSLEVREAVKSHSDSANFYDAPVSGGVLGAEKASMTFMLGCAEGDKNHPKIKAILELMGSKIFPCGGPSLGITAKLCNNYCSALIAVATSEAMSIGISSGMDPRVLSKIFSASLAQSRINDDWNPVPGVVPDAPASNGYKPGFKIELMRKDFNLAKETAERNGVNLALGETGLDVYTKAMNDERCKGLDSRVVFRYLGGDENWQKRFDRE